MWGQGRRQVRERGPNPPNPTPNPRPSKKGIVAGISTPPRSPGLIELPGAIPILPREHGFAGGMKCKQARVPGMRGGL